jgi:hypothetical protein
MNQWRVWDIFHSSLVAEVPQFGRTICSSHTFISEAREMTPSFQASWFAPIYEIMTDSKICYSSFYFIEDAK